MHLQEIVKGVGLSIDQKPIMDRTRGRTLKHHALMYVIKGAGHFEDKSAARRPVRPGTLFYLYPGVWHNFDPAPGTVWTEYWVLFNGLDAQRAFGDILPPPRASFHQPGLAPGLIKLYEDLHDAWLCRDQSCRAVVLLLLHEVLGEAWKLINHLAFNRRNTWVRRVQTFLGENLNLPECDLRKFAAAENISHETLRKRIKRQTGFSPKQYWLMLKINRARELLLSPDKRVKDIALDLGFNDQYYFSRLFRQREGLSPREYRRRHLAESNGRRSRLFRAGQP